MCQPDRPGTVADALGMLHTALDYLNGCDPASLPTSMQAGALRELAAAEAKHTAARSAVLSSFTAQRGFEDDGQGSAQAGGISGTGMKPKR